MAKYAGWRNFPTMQFKEIIAELEEAKKEQKSLMIIANTGDGKSNAIAAFIKANPRNTYLVTLGDSYNLMAVLSELQEKLGWKTPGMFFQPPDKVMEAAAQPQRISLLGIEGLGIVDRRTEPTQQVNYGPH